MTSMTLLYHLKEPTLLIMYSYDYIVAVCMQCAIRSRNCECTDMQIHADECSSRPPSGSGSWCGIQSVCMHHAP